MPQKRGRSRPLTAAIWLWRSGDFPMPTKFSAGPRRRRQFSMRSLLLLSLCSTALIAGLLGLSGWPHTAGGIGQADITLHFVVVDTVASAPIPGAVVRLYEADPPWTVTDRARASALGQAEITRRFALYFRTGSFLERGESIVHFDNWNVEVSAEGYKATRCWLPCYTGRVYDLDRSPPELTVVVKLKRLGLSVVNIIDAKSADSDQLI